MENTGKILAGTRSKAEWFLSLGEESVGPLTPSDILERIDGGKITYFHYVWKQGFSEWKRICDIADFQNAKPKAPSKKPAGSSVDAHAAPVVKKAAPKTTTKTASKLAPEKKEWFLYYNDSQFGPFSKPEVAGYLELGKIHPKIHVWKDGLASWTLLKDVPELKDIASHSKAKVEKASERRKGMRKPLIARILMTSDAKVVAAVCRDISVGGMQVLTDKIPGKVGSKIRMNVSSAGSLKGSEIAPFVAEGVIVRILEDGRGFSFRFDKLNEESKKSIESFLKKNG